MKRSLKILLILLGFCLMSGTGLCDFDKKVEAVRNQEYKEAMELMQVLGVLTDDVEYDPNALVSRQDLALYTAKLLGVEATEVESRYFVDVPSSGYATWAINYLTEAGIFSTNQDKMFYPKENADINQVCKVLTSVLGYSRYAENAGGYPMGYIEASNLAELDIQEFQNVTFENLMILLYRTARANLYSVLSAGGGTVTMEKEDETLLSRYYDMYEGEGTVKAVSGMTVSSDLDVQNDVILIGDEQLELGVTVYEPDFLGKYVRYFYTEDKNDNCTVKAVFPSDDEEDMVTEIKNIESFSQKQLVYETSSGKRKTEDLLGFSWIYNGRPLESDISATLNSLNKGSVILRDSDDDGNHDTVLIFDYKNFIVSSINETDQIIYNKLKTTENIKPDDYENIIIYDEKHNKLSIEDISVNNVLSVALSKDKDILSVIVSTAEFNGTLLGQNEESVSINLNSGEFEIEPSYIEEYKKSGINVGNVYHYKTDAFGYVCYIYSGVSDNPMKFGYVIEGKKVDDDYETLMLRILKQDSTVDFIRVAEKVRIDGAVKKNVDDAIFAFPQKSNKGELISPQMIRYELNADGDIRAIDTTFLNSQYETKDNSLTVFGDENYSAKWYRRNRIGIDAYLDNANSDIFAIPEQALSDGFDEQEYRVGKVSTMLIEDRSIYANVYTASGRSEFAEAMVHKYQYAKIGRNSAYTSIEMILVDSISKTVNDDGEVVDCIKGMRGGSEVLINIPDGVSTENIGTGDIIQLRYGINDQIVPSYTLGEPDIILIYDYSKYKGSMPEVSDWKGVSDSMTLFERVNNPAYNDYRSERQLSFGFATDKTDNYLWWGYKIPGEYDEMFKISDVPIMVYDKNAVNGKKCYKGTVDDIEDFESCGEDCDTVILHTGVGIGRGLFVYK